MILTIEEAMSSGATGEVNIICPNPDHDDRNPSAWVNTLSGLWVCFSCGAGGKIDTENYEIDMGAATKELARLTMLMEKEGVERTEGWLSQFDSSTPGDYWLGRFSAATCREFRLGVDYHRNQATIPLRDLNGVPLGVIRRNLGDGPKYVYPTEIDISDYLFAYHQCTDDVVILTEGATDTIAAWEVGHQAMAIYGSRLSKAQRIALEKYNPKALILAYDQDEAGDQAARNTAAWFPHLVVERAEWGHYKDLSSMPITVRRIALQIARRNVRNRLAQTIQKGVASSS